MAALKKSLQAISLDKFLTLNFDAFVNFTVIKFSKKFKRNLMGGCTSHIYKQQRPNVLFDLDMILTTLKGNQKYKGIPENITISYFNNLLLQYYTLGSIHIQQKHKQTHTKWCFLLNGSLCRRTTLKIFIFYER